MKVKLMTGLTYRRQGLFFTRGDVAEVDDSLGASLMKTGRFKDMDEPAAEPIPEPEAQEEPKIEPTLVTIPKGGNDPAKTDGAVTV